MPIASRIQELQQRVLRMQGSAITRTLESFQACRESFS